MTRRELREHCIEQDYCADCEYYVDMDLKCIIVHDGHILYPYQYPDSVMDDEIREPKEHHEPSITEAIIVGLTIGVVAGTIIVGVASLLCRVLELILL